MKVNRYIHCKNKLEAITRSTFKPKNTDLLYCIIDKEIYVYQRFQLLKIPLNLFAEGMEIELLEAQKILNNEIDSEVTTDELKEIKQNTSATLESVQFSKEELEEVVSETEVEEVKEKQLTDKEVILQIIDELINRIQLLEKEVFHKDEIVSETEVEEAKEEFAEDAEVELK